MRTSLWRKLGTTILRDLCIIFWDFVSRDFMENMGTAIDWLCLAIELCTISNVHVTFLVIHKG